MTRPRAHFYLRTATRNGKKRVLGYVIEFYDPYRRPKRKRISLGTKEQTTAARRFADYERRWDEGKFDPWTDLPIEEGVTVADALERFLADREKAGRSAGSIGTYRAVLGSFVRHLPPSYPLYGIQASDVKDWLKTGNRTESTQDSYTERVRIFCSWAVERNLLKANPIPKRSTRTQKRRKRSLPRFLREEEEARLIAAIEADAILKPAIDGGNQWLLDIIRFALGTGLRRGELINLRWGDIDLPERTAHVRNRVGFTTKSGRERSVPLAGDALTVVTGMAEERTCEDHDAHVFTGVGGDPVNPDYLSKRFRFYRDLAKLPTSICFHGLRHTYATRLVQRGTSVYKVQALLGHASVATTQQYAHLTGSELREDVETALRTGPTEVEILREEVARLQLENAALKARHDVYESLRTES